jgi:hypothetical protein
MMKFRESAEKTPSVHYILFDHCDNANNLHLVVIVRTHGRSSFLVLMLFGTEQMLQRRMAPCIFSRRHKKLVLFTAAVNHSIETVLPLPSAIW